jgi:tetratricopeptide (TPR) repeat protein
MDALKMWREFARKEQPPPQEAIDLYRRAIQAGFSGDWDQAEALLADSLEPLEAAGAPEAAAANHNLAVIHFERGDSDGAVFHCIRGLFLYNRSSDIGGLYAALRNLAVIHKTRGEDSLAVSASREAARARGELTARGLLEEAESGRDGQGEPLKLLSEPAAGISHLEAV